MSTSTTRPKQIEGQNPNIIDTHLLTLPNTPKRLRASHADRRTQSPPGVEIRLVAPEVRAEAGDDGVGDEGAALLPVPARVLLPARADGEGGELGGYVVDGRHGGKL